MSEKEEEEAEAAVAMLLLQYGVQLMGAEWTRESPGPISITLQWPTLDFTAWTPFSLYLGRKEEEEEMGCNVSFFLFKVILPFSF
jgi:hypothetical protein